MRVIPGILTNFHELLSLRITCLNPFRDKKLFPLDSMPQRISELLSVDYWHPGREATVSSLAMSSSMSSSSPWRVGNFRTFLLALISANLVTVAGIFPMTRFACCETSSANCDSSLSVVVLKESGTKHLLQPDSCQILIVNAYSISRTLSFTKSSKAYGMFPHWIASNIGNMRMSPETMSLLSLSLFSHSHRLWGICYRTHGFLVSL